MESFREMCLNDASEFGKEMATEYKLNLVQKGKVMAALKKLPK